MESLDATREGAGVLQPHDFTIQRLDVINQDYREQTTPKRAIFQAE